MRNYKFALALVVVLSLLAVTVFSNQQKTNATGQPPEILSLSIEGSTGPVVEVKEGSVSYEIMIRSSDKATVSFFLVNQKTNEETIIFADQQLGNEPNTGSFEVAKGKYYATVTAADEDGLEAEPISIELVVGAEEDVFSVTVTPDPILIQNENETSEIEITVKNHTEKMRAGTVLVYWADEEHNPIGRFDLEAPGKYLDGGKTTLLFSLAPNLKGEKERELVVEVEADTLEMELENNKKIVSVQYEFPDLDVMFAEPRLVEQTETEYTLELPVQQRDLPGRSATLSTELEYGTKEGKKGTLPVILEVGEEKWLRVTIPKTSWVYRHVNPAKNSPIQEWEWENNYLKTDLNVEAQFNYYAVKIEPATPTYRQGENVTSVVTVGHTAGSMDDKEPKDVVLYLDTVEIGRQKVYIPPGEERVLSFSWTVPKTGDLKPASRLLKATINPQGRDEETNPNDNDTFSRVTVLTKQITGSTCAGRTIQTSAVSGTYEYYCNCLPSGGCAICIGTYTEAVTMQPEYNDATTVKAGMGFPYKLKTTYYNDNPHNGNHHGFWGVTAEFDRPDTATGDVVLPDLDLVPEQNLPNADNTWHFPRAKIQRGQGDMEMIEYLYTLDELGYADDDPEFVDGGNEAFTSFYQRDGVYSFAVMGYGAGVKIITHTDIEGKTTFKSITPRLEGCVEHTYTVSGSPHDDFIIRRVDPNIPFPQDGLHGWDWDGYEYIFEQLAPWWNTYGRENPYGLDVKEWTIHFDR